MNEVRILCVDDDERVLDGLEAALAFDWRVYKATAGQEGLKILAEQRRFPVIISDIKMPGMDGLEFLAHARALCPDSLQILLTGYADVDTAISAVNRGQIFRFLTKPCPSEALISAVEAALKQHRLIQAERELLEGTVRGAVQAMVDMLSIAAPTAFSLTGRIRDTALEVARGLQMKGLWELEVAALLLQIRYVALPRELMERVLLGSSLTPQEQQMREQSQDFGINMIANVPRLQAIAEILRGVDAPSPHPSQSERLQLFSAILSATADLQARLSRGVPLELALSSAALRHPPEIIERLEGVVRERARSGQSEIPISRALPGMILEEDLKSSLGVLVLRAGTALSDAMVERLQRMVSHSGLPDRIVVRGDIFQGQSLRLLVPALEAS